ncbi:MAG: cytidine deaminase [Balneolales bacterium]|nr:cytidine deaminase [Balneolales bacterium]
MIWETLNKRAYVPYSQKPGSCVVRGNKGGLYAGVRIESISFPLSIPAVQAACCICLSEGETPTTIYVQDKNIEQLSFWVEEYSCSISLDIDFKLPELSNLKKELPSSEITVLKEILNNSVTPNSDFPVSAILYVQGGCFEGVNVEVSGWTMGLCAERVALAKAVATGTFDFLDIAIHTRKGEFSSPCGGCRQVLHEHLPLQKVKLHHADGTFSQHFVLDLLPFSFAGTSLKQSKS